MSETNGGADGTKPLVMSKTPAVVAMATLLGTLAGHYGLELSDQETFGLAMLCQVVAGYVMRALSKRTIAGIVKTPEAGA